jgi:hypothetical protein
MLDTGFPVCYGSALQTQGGMMSRPDEGGGEMPDELKTAIATYDDNLEDWLKNNLAGKFVLIHQTEVAGTYVSERDAINEGYRRYRNVPFLVREILPTEKRLSFLSGNVKV